MKPRIAILGAGPMGLAAAYACIQKGYQPLVYEADDRVGGMAASFDFGGLEIERYYHFHVRSDRAWIEMVDTLGLTERLHWVPTKMGYWYQKRIQPWGTPSALFRFKGLSLLAKTRAGLHAALSLLRSRWDILDRQEATTWLKRWIGREAYEVLWHPLFAYKFHEHAEQLSAAWIWRRMHRVGRSRNRGGKEVLGYIEGGSKIILEAMKVAIESGGGKIFLRSPVTKVVLDSKRVTGITVANQLIPCDLVLSTLPLPYIPKLIPDLPEPILHAFRSIKNSAVACVIVKLRKPLTPYFWLNINDPSHDFPGLIEYSNLYPMETAIAYVPFYLPQQHPHLLEPDAFFTDKVKRFFKEIHPHLSDSDFLDWSVHRYAYAQPIYEPQFKQKLPPMRLPIQGLWVADTSHYYPEDRGLSESLAFGRHMAHEALS